MKKSKKLVLAILPLVTLLVGCNKTAPSSTGSNESNTQNTTSSTRKTVYVTDFTLEKDSFELEVNGTAQINATLTPKNATKKGFNYTTSNAAIATVSSEGVITAISSGTCTIEVETKGTKEDGSTVKKNVNVTVKAPALVSLTIANPSITIKEQATATISYEVKPSNAVDKSVTFVSADETIATVSAAGVITGVKEGETDITVTTKAKDAQGNALTGTVHVTVESLTIVHKVEFQNDDGSLLQAIDNIEEGDVPEFTADIPSKATDANGIYVFRGFDKDIVKYAKPADPKASVVYKAVYESVKVTPRAVTLTKEKNTETNEEKAIFTVSGEAIGFTTETIKEKAFLALAEKGGSWGTTYTDALSPIINANGTWTMQMEVGLDKFKTDTIYMGKYIWDSTEAKNPTDLKLLHKATELRYRHTADGKALEDNKIPNDWDGTFPENYVSDGYINDTTTSQLTTVEDRQAYVNSIAGPTWVGLGLSYTPADFMINGYRYTLFSNDEVWQLPSIKIEGELTTNNETATLVEKDGVVYYRVSGDAADFAVAGEKSGFSIDFQHNSNIDKESGWTTSVNETNGTGAITEDKKWYYDIPVSNNNALTNFDTRALNAFTVHFGIPGAAKSDLKCAVAEDYKSIDKNGLRYSIRKDSSTWNIPALVVEPVLATEVTDVTKLGYEIKNTNQVYLNIAGKVEGVTGQAKLVAGTGENEITLDNTGKFETSVRVDDKMVLNNTKSFDANKAYTLKIIDSSSKQHALKLNGLADNVALNNVSLTAHDATTNADVKTNFVIVNKGGIALTTVNSTWTATRTELYEKDGKAMLHVSGVLLAGTSIEDLKLRARVGDNDLNDAFALDATTYDVATGKVEFEADITNWAVMSDAKLKMQNGNIAGEGGKGINWFWCNDWTAIKKGDAITVGNKTYKLGFSNNTTLTITEQAAA